ncbi:hypothetical protein GM418_08840 [Maribellus comscasis]|uniref:Uncharacterized protein n=1 Tax=Maribellus comscasis TaxID=2681766 RepID=A0A6I6JRC2_9BACT|nr:hypothetical protein [Maribellus comscasis]QGY43759.1 hypothetical protein GM418_08840 [Maribellus comscasis]
MENRFSFFLTDEEKEQVKEAIQVLVSVLEPKLMTLTPEERKELPKMGDKTVAFVEKAVEYAEQYPSYIPAFIDVSETRSDFEAVKAIRLYYTQLQRLTDTLDDSMLLAGSEAYISSLSVYKVLKNAAGMGQPGAEEAVAELAARFPRGKRTTVTE